MGPGRDPDPSSHRLEPFHTSTPSKEPPWQTKHKVPPEGSQCKLLVHQDEAVQTT